MRDERIEAGLCFFLLGRVRPGSRWLQLKVAIHIAFVKEARDIGAPYFGSGFGFGFFFRSAASCLTSLKGRALVTG